MVNGRVYLVKLSILNYNIVTLAFTLSIMIVSNQGNTAVQNIIY